MKPIRIKNAFLHATAEMSNFSGTSLNQDRLPGVKLWWCVESYSLIIEYKGTRVRTPLSNVKTAIEFSKEEETQLEKKA